MTQDEYDEASTKALSLFEYGQVSSLLFVFFCYVCLCNYRLIPNNKGVELNMII